MFANYLKTAVRNICRHKVHSAINIAGLAVGMACAITILLWVRFELSFDRYHEHADRIYRLATDLHFGTLDGKFAVSNHPAGPTLQRDYPEVEKAVRFHPVWGQSLVRYRDKEFVERDIFYADNTVFDVFTFPLIRGDSGSALAAAYSVVMTENTARKYFGVEDPVGKVIKIGNVQHADLDNDTGFTVTGVMRNVPANSHFTFEMLISFETIYRDNERQRNRWTGDIDNYTYLLLAPNTDYKELDKKLPALVDRYLEDEIKAVGANMDFFLQPLPRIHLHSRLKAEISYGDILAVYTFIIVAALIIIIAGINFMNLATARSAGRAREVGIRKALGADRRALVTQFMGESVVLSIVASVLVMGLVELLLPLFRSQFLWKVDFENVYTASTIGGLFGLAILAGCLAGSYPALFLSSFQPMQTLKGGLAAGACRARIRGLLVVLQFTISIFMIIATMVVFSQFHYMQNKALGFDSEQVLVLKFTNRFIRQSIDSVKAQLKSHSSISGVAFTSHQPGRHARRNVFAPEGFSYDQMKEMDAVSVDSDFVPTMEIEMAAGRNFRSGQATENEQAILINQTAARQFGWTDAVGKTITELTQGLPKKTIVGVMKDFHQRNLYNPIEPLYIENDPEKFAYVLVKIRPGHVSEAMGFLRKKWKEIDSSNTFDHWFLDEGFEEHYGVMRKLGNLLLSFTLLAVIIACLGLFGLAAFTAEQRTREIGIRKALGASVSDIVLLLSKAFAKWVLLANVIAWPLAYLVSQDWVEDYPYRIAVKPAFFVAAGLAALIIALATVSWQAVKAARANPVDALRYE